MKLRLISTLWVILNLAQYSISQTQVGIVKESTCESQTSNYAVPDCNCKFSSVNHASKLLSPLLTNLTSRTFFRYFYVNLESPCPFWHEDGQCVMEGCSVCTCGENEIPKTWLETENAPNIKFNNEFGWITSNSSSYGYEGMGHDDSLGRISFSANNNNNNKYVQASKDINGNGNGNSFVYGYNNNNNNGNYMQFLRETEDCDKDEWTVLSNIDKDDKTSNNNKANTYFDVYSNTNNHMKKGVYVNLLQNPERFTGYGGVSARRVWKIIQEENCFGELNDICLEKRIFHRLMSGMQASISTHIARNYLYPNNKWDVNIPLYENAVGNHIDRLNNMYFAFLFLLRSVIRAEKCLLAYPYNTGNSTDDSMVKELLHDLILSNSNHLSSSGSSSHNSQVESSSSNSIEDLFSLQQSLEECKYAFDESELFQVPEYISGPQYWDNVVEKQQLKEQFRVKFRNISQAMDCVTCEKCKLWGKLQILGFGTAVKILLTPNEELQCTTPFDLNHQQLQISSDDIDLLLDNNKDNEIFGESCMDSSVSNKQLEKKQKPTYVKKSAYSSQIVAKNNVLNRQEIIALLNTLNQLTKSIEFAAKIQNGEM